MRPQFTWTKVGRSHVASFGNLSVVIRERGSATAGYRWMVEDVFGARHLGKGWHAYFERARNEAERLAVREALSLASTFCSPGPAPRGAP